MHGHAGKYLHAFIFGIACIFACGHVFWHAGMYLACGHVFLHADMYLARGMYFKCGHVFEWHI